MGNLPIAISISSPWFATIEHLFQGRWNSPPCRRKTPPYLPIPKSDIFLDTNLFSRQRSSHFTGTIDLQYCRIFFVQQAARARRSQKFYLRCRVRVHGMTAERRAWRTVSSWPILYAQFLSFGEKLGNEKSTAILHARPTWLVKVCS